jgi:nitrate reductase beta subunit
VSLVLQKDLVKDQIKPSYRVLTYTSKNEFYVIDISKSKKPNSITADDLGISTAEGDSEEEKTSDHNFSDKN